MNLPSLPQDKANHALYGQAVYAAYRHAAVYFGMDVETARLTGVFFTVLVGILKEAVDWWLNDRAVRKGFLPTHGVEVWDAVATSGGGLSLYLLGV